MIFAPAAADLVVRSGVFEMPVGIEENSDWTGSRVLVHRLEDVQRSVPEDHIHQENALWPANRKDVSACAGKQNEVVCESSRA